MVFNGFKDFVHCFSSHEWIIDSSIDNCVFNFCKLHPLEVNLNVFKHFFDIYISLNLDEFDYDYVIHLFIFIVNSCAYGCHFSP